MPPLAKRKEEPTVRKTNDDSYDNAPAAGADAGSVLEARLDARAGLLDEALQGDFVLE